MEHGILFLIGVLFLVYLIYSYSMNKSMGPEQMSDRKKQEMYSQQMAAPQQGGVQPSQPLGQNETYASATGMATSTQGLPPSCSKSPVQYILSFLKHNFLPSRAQITLS